MHLSEHSLRQLDRAYLDALDEAALRALSARLLQGCSTLESLVGEEPVEVEGIVVEAQADITDAIETQQVEGKAT